MTENNPLVSVVMASFNEPCDVLEQAINSILNQTYRHLELIIVDDSTNEDTINTLLSYKDTRIQLIRNEGHCWLPEKLNIALRHSKGKYIARMDADDEALPDRVEKQVRYLEKHSEIYVLGGQVNLMNEKGEIFSRKKYPLGGIKLYIHSTFKSPFNHPSVMMRKELVERGFFYNEKLIKTSEDIDLWLRIIHSGYKIANLPDMVTNYRVRNNMAEWRGSRQEVEYMAQVRKNAFSIRRPLHSLLSMINGWIFLHLPRSMVYLMYKSIYKK